jgi:beta-glucosidase
MGSTLPVDVAALLKTVEKADVVVFAGGIAPSLEGEEMPVSAPGFRGGDRENIQLPTVQRNIVKALKQAGKRVVFVNFSGSAMGLAPESKNCEAVLQAWYPGQAGGTAVAEVLMGRYNPAGRLPVTFYTDIKQLPDFQDYSMRGRTYRYFQGKPLYSFGYGLSYTTFEYGKAKLSKGSMAKDETVTISVPVKNRGKMAGEEVVQVYIRRVDDVEGPIKSLKAFKRISLKPGQTMKVDLELPAERFECFDTKSNAMRVMSGKYEIMYGSSSRAEDLQKISFVIK